MDVEHAPGLVWLVDLQPVNRDTGAVEVFRLSDVGYTSLPTDTPAHETWETGLIEPPEISQSLAQGRALGGEVKSDPGTVRVYRSPGRLAWADPRRYAWRNARALVRVGLPGGALSTFKTLADGVVVGPPKATGPLEFELADASVVLDEPYLGPEDKLLGVGPALRIGTGAIVRLLPATAVKLAQGFAARFLLRPVSLGDTSFGTGTMTLLRNFSSSTGMRLELRPTGPPVLRAGDLRLEVAGLTPSVFTVNRTWPIDQWDLVAVNFDPISGTVQLAVGQEVLGTWSVTGTPIESTVALRTGWANTADDYDMAHVQWVHGGLDPAEVPSWIAEPVPRDVGLASYWWILGDGAGHPQDSGPSKEHAILPTTGAARWVHSEEGGAEQAGAVRYIPMGGPVENVSSLLLDPNRYVYLASGRDDARVLAVYSNAGPLEASSRDRLDWTFTMVDANNGDLRVKLDGSGGREIQAGDFLLYDVQWNGETLTSTVGGGSISIGDWELVTVQIVFTDGTRTAIAGGTDQHGLSILPGTDLRAHAGTSYYLRLISLAAWVGKTIDWVEVQCVDPADSSGFETREVLAKIRRIEVTDAFGTLREMVWAPRDGVPATSIAASSHPANTYQVVGPDGHWIQLGKTFMLFNDPQGTTITHDVRGATALGSTPLSIARALVAELGVTLDTATLDALQAELSVGETLGVATEDYVYENLTPSNGTIRPEENADEDPDRPDDDWLEAPDDTGTTQWTPGFELPAGPYRTGDVQSVELLLRRSNAAVATAPQITVKIQQPSGFDVEPLTFFEPISMDGSGIARMSFTFSGNFLDHTEPLFVFLQGAPVTEGGQFSTVEIGAVQLRVQRYTHGVALLLDEDRSYRDLLNTLLLSAGLQWQIDRLRRFTVSRLDDPDDVVTETAGILASRAHFVMVAEAGAEYRMSLWTGTQAVTAATVLTYPVLWRPEPGLAGASIAVDLVFDDGSKLSTSGLVDDAGFAARPDEDLGEVAVGRWYRRRIPLGVLAGKTLTRVDVVCRKENGGSAEAWLGDVLLKTAGTGAIERSLWTGDGDVSFVSSSDPGQTGVVETVFDRDVAADLEVVEDDVASLVPLEPDPPVWTEAATYRLNHTTMTDTVVTTASPERRLFLRDEVRLESLRRPEVLATYEDAIDGGTLSTVLVRAAEAQRLLDRRSAFFGQPNRAFDVAVLFDSAQDFLDRLDAAQVTRSVWLTHPEHGLHFGEAFRIIRVGVRDGLLTLTLWRPR